MNPEPLKVIIVDDEPIARKGMQRLVSRRPELQVVATLGSAEEASAFMAENAVDMLFLDIQMPGTNGIDFARRIPRDTLVIFTTAYSEYALDSYEVNSIDYLVKPIDPARFDRAVDKAVSYHRLLAASSSDDAVTATAADHIVVKSDRRFHRVSLDDILFVEGLKDYVIIHLADRRIITRMTIKSMEDTLSFHMFLRVNKSYIVNRRHIDSWDTNDIFIGPHEIAIGPSYRDHVLQALQQ